MPLWTSVTPSSGNQAERFRQDSPETPAHLQVWTRDAWAGGLPLHPPRGLPGFWKSCTGSRRGLSPGSYSYPPFSSSLPPILSPPFTSWIPLCESLCETFQASVSSSLTWANHRVMRRGNTPGAQVKHLVTVPRWPRSGVLCFVLLCRLTHDPGNGRPQLWLPCLPPKTSYLPHLLALTQKPGCASAGQGGPEMPPVGSGDRSETVKHQ